ncbi:hypothetical protein F2P79_021673 [Pimephales promelas]|nr:hypothetical protein F2P79_021673 [Pimephales promelas]
MKAIATDTCLMLSSSLPAGHWHAIRVARALGGFDPGLNSSSGARLSPTRLPELMVKCMC